MKEMADKLLNFLVKVLAIVILVVIAIMGSALYKNKYMLVQGEERTLEHSVYSSKDLEVAISSINLTDNKLGVTVRNKSNKKLNITLEELEINGKVFKSDINIDVDEHSIAEDESIIAKLSKEDIGEPKSLKCRFIVNQKHNIEVSLSLNSTKMTKEQKV